MLGLWLAPWAAIARQTGARSAVILLPGRLIDFTGRTDPLTIPGLGLTLILCLLALGVVLFASFLKEKQRALLWLMAGLVLIVTTFASMATVQQRVRLAKLEIIQGLINEELADPGDRTDVAALTACIDHVVASLG